MDGGEYIMKNFVIYLAGGMQKFGKENFEQSEKWRRYCTNFLRGNNDYYNITVVNPNDYFNFVNEIPQYDTQREVMEFDLNKVRNSDLIIVNFNDKYSLGTMAELAIAYEKRIPVIGLHTEQQILHPWQREMCNRIFHDIDKMLNYINNFYLT